MLRRLHPARQHLRMCLGQIDVWRLSPEELDELCFVVSLRHSEHLTKVLRSAANVFPIEDCRCPASMPLADLHSTTADFIEALAQLRTCANDPMAGDHWPSLHKAIRSYEVLAHRDLVEPLMRLAREQSNPALAIGIDELASLAGLLHRLRPRIEVLQSVRERAQAIQILPQEILDQYLEVSTRFRSMLREV